MKFFFFVLISVFSFQAFSMQLDLNKDIPKVLNYSLFDPAADAKVSGMTPLERLKYAEIRKKSSVCNQIAPGVYAKFKDLRGWIALSWLRCNPSAPSEAALDKIAQNPELFERGGWHQALWSLWSDQSLDLLDGLMKKKSPKAEKRIQALLDFGDRLGKDDRSQLFRYRGELAQQKKDYARALFYYQESMDLRETAAATEKIRFLKKALNLPFTEQEKNSADNAPALPEQQIEDRMNTALRAGESIAALKDAVDILNSYPGSRVARRLKDKPLEIYGSLLDRGNNIDGGVLAKALETMGEADATRLADWASSLHRRADYKGALNLADRALTVLRTSPASTNLLWIAGRSSEFMGDYSGAIRYFDELALQHRGSDEASEALFRMGLIQYRLMNDATATVLFEKVLTEKKDRYELNARYWMYRSLQRQKSDRAEALRQEISARFPFSYYGLRLRAEANKNKISWPALPAAGTAAAPATVSAVDKEFTAKNNMKVWLEGSQITSWKRFTELIKNGWVNEAQNEFRDFPAPQNIQAQTLLGQKLSEAGLASVAIRWINDAMDQDPSLRKKDILSLAFPQPFKDLYIKEGSRNDINARLLMSLTRQESAFNARATSSSNALGLMQLIPPTAKEVAQKLGYKKIDIPEDLFRPEINIAMGSFYVADMLKQFNDSVPFALAAYNAGPVRVNLWIQARPELQKQMSTPSSAPEDEIWFDELPWNETSFYVKAILRNTLLYRLINDGDFDLSPVIWSDLVNKKTVAQ